MVGNTSQMLTYDSTNNPAFRKTTSDSQGKQQIIMLYLTINRLASLEPPKHNNLLKLLLQQFKNQFKGSPLLRNPTTIRSISLCQAIPGQQKIIMGISMSQSEEIRRLKLHDLQYREKSLVRFHSSSPAQFRDIENQQVDNKAKHKQVITEPSFKMKQQQPRSRINQTLNYELDMDLQEVTPRTKTKGKGTERLRESNPVKENSYSEVLRVSKAQEYHNNEASPSAMRARKVKIGKK